MKKFLIVTGCISLIGCATNRNNVNNRNHDLYWTDTYKDCIKQESDAVAKCTTKPIYIYDTPKVQIYSSSESALP